MHEVKLSIIFLVFAYFVYSALSDALRGLEVIPERAEITYSSDKYVVNNSVNVRRYSRRGGYVVNFWGITKHTWANNVTIKRRKSLRDRGIKCPMPKGFNGIANASMSLPKFPYVFPFQRCKAEVIFKTEPSHEMIGKGHLILLVKQLPLNKVKMN